jgi:hypothetical protein
MRKSGPAAERCGDAEVFWADAEVWTCDAEVFWADAEVWTGDAEASMGAPNIRSLD